MGVKGREKHVKKHGGGGGKMESSEVKSNKMEDMISVI